jgi:hypothetical protein
MPNETRAIVLVSRKTLRPVKTATNWHGVRSIGPPGTPLVRSRSDRYPGCHGADQARWRSDPNLASIAAGPRALAANPGGSSPTIRRAAREEAANLRRSILSSRDRSVATAYLLQAPLLRRGGRSLFSLASGLRFRPRYSRPAPTCAPPVAAGTLDGPQCDFPDISPSGTKADQMDLLRVGQHKRGK